MFAAKKMSVPEIEPQPSPAAIASGVRKSGAHQTLALRITKLEGERQDALDQMRLLISSNRNETNDKSISKLEKERVSIEDKLRPFKMEVRAHRDAHSKAVAEELTPMCKEAAHAIIEGLDRFVTAAQKFNACQDEIERVGGEPQRIYIAAIIGAYEHFARCFLGECA
jgi:uncharacterized protein YdcH (DUF465 family)